MKDSVQTILVGGENKKLLNEVSSDASAVSNSNNLGQTVQSTSRVIQTNVGNIEYPDNTIQTSKYNCLTFIPKNIFYQFNKIANFYFLVKLFTFFLYSFIDYWITVNGKRNINH